jgi:acyl-CoA thioester hydrolase
MFELELTVRDYECDMQGIVNHATYLNYLEHTRHIFLTSRGLNFSEITRQGILLVVAKITINYRQPLKPDDKFISRLKIVGINKAKVVFCQELAIQNDIYLNAEVVVVASQNGKIMPIPKEIKTSLS